VKGTFFGLWRLPSFEQYRGTSHLMTPILQRSMDENEPFTSTALPSPPSLRSPHISYGRNSPSRCVPSISALSSFVHSFSPSGGVFTLHSET